jgi:mannose-1-phosphate guanylyltransferase
MQALILVGGEGTRLRPLTSNRPKPVVSLVDRPFIVYMLDWLRGHGVDQAILSCGFLADGVKQVLGDGSQFGVALRYVEEPEPLGTGGALKYAEELLEERFFMLNGDVLTDMDLTAQLRHHEQIGARATLALIGVDDPSAYGLVRRREDTSVTEFVEKPSTDEIDTNLVNAGAYILEREILAEMAPAGTKISIEREVFPRLVNHGLYGYDTGTAYWLDIGTPERYMQGTFDILEGDVRTEIGRRLAASGGIVRDGECAGTVHAPAVISAGCSVAAGAIVGGRTVLGPGVTVSERAHIDSSVILDGCQIGPGARISGSILAPGVTVGARCQIDGRVVIGEQVKIGPGNRLSGGMRIFPGVELPEGAIAF